MTSFIRLLELAGIKVILEALTPTQAAAIFKSNGATDDDLKSPQSIKLARNKLVKKLHSDVAGGDDDAVKYVNAAYDILKTLPSGYQKVDSRSYQSRDEDGVPEWQTDRRSYYNRINRENCTDLNYFMKSMWEKSGHSRQKFTISAFDGKYFSSCVTVFGSEDIFADMARGMYEFNSKGGNPYETRAVFVQKGSYPTLYLIYLDGEITEPTVIDHDSPNMNPGNDQQFVRMLPDMLDSFKSHHVKS